MEKILVLGGGLIGRAIAATAARDPEKRVTLADKSSEALTHAHVLIQRIASDAHVRLEKLLDSDTALMHRLIQENDLVMSAVPGKIGHEILRMVINNGRNVVSIAFPEEDPFTLDDLARKNGVIAAVDAGVAPGMSHILAAYAASQLEAADTIGIYVGGLPVHPEPPHNYKAPFAKMSVIDECKRPSIIKRNGKLITVPALSGVERIRMPGAQRGLEAFYTDGLRTLVRTMQGCRTMYEKTLRYPGHAAQMRFLRDTGLLDDDALPILAQKLFPHWELGDEEDMTVMLVRVEGENNGQRVRHEYYLNDRRDPVTGIHSMARTTGYTATAIAEVILKGGYCTHGITPPEYFGKDPKLVKSILSHLEERGVHYHHTVKSL